MTRQVNLDCGNLVTNRTGARVQGGEAASTVTLLRYTALMSDLAPGDLSYQLVVAEYFLGLSGKGLMVSPLDRELVADWERRGLPVPVVLRGLQQGWQDFELRRAPGASAPRSIRALRFAVEDEWRAFTSRAVGDAPPPPNESGAAGARLDAARRRLAEAVDGAPAAWRTGYRAALAELDATVAAGPGVSLERVEAAVAAADARLLSAWLASLDRPRRAALGPRLALRAGPRHRGASRRAHRETLRHHLLEAARAAGLTCLRGTV